MWRMLSSIPLGKFTKVSGIVALMVNLL
jgi:hypothetical protein